jgi:hypothetical protein
LSEQPVILGFSSGMAARYVTPFLESLRRTEFSGRVCVFVCQTSAEDVAAITRLADRVITVDDDYPPLAPRWAVAGLKRMKVTRGLRRHFGRAYGVVVRRLHAAPGSAMARDLEYQLQGIQALRYRHYLQFLEGEPEVDHVMISDLRDVVFQDDPFAGDVGALEVYLEEPHVRVSTPGFNSTWIRDLYGAEGLRDLGDAVVSCSGVTIGAREPMMTYLRAMADELDRHVIPLGPHDQGVHNWLLYNGRLPDATPIANGTGRVLTMGAQNEIYLSPAGGVVKADGTRPAVLHQYDRHVGLAERLRSELDT